MNPLVLAYLERQVARIERRKLVKLAGEIRDLNRKAEPLRKQAAEQRRAGVKGEGFIMKPSQ